MSICVTNGEKDFKITQEDRSFLSDSNRGFGMKIDEMTTNCLVNLPMQTTAFVTLLLPPTNQKAKTPEKS